MANALRIIFAGTPDFAAEHLQALLNTDHQVVAAYTQPDRKAGRGKKLTASPVKQLALEHDIPVYQPASLKDETAQGQLAEIEADIMVVVAYGLILPKAVLTTPRLGCINVHGSLLPKWRGAAPIQRAIWAGDTHTGVTIMQMDEGLDTGAMLHTEQLTISNDETSASLYQRLAELGSEALVKVLDKIESLQAVEQDDTLATYAKKLSKAEAQVDWQTPAEQLERNIRAFNPWPAAWVTVGNANIKLWAATVLDEPDNTAPGIVIRADKHGIVVATGQGQLNITSLQIPGKKPLAAADVVNARPQWFVPGQPIGGHSAP